MARHGVAVAWWMNDTRPRRTKHGKRRATQHSKHGLLQVRASQRSEARKRWRLLQPSVAHSKPLITQSLSHSVTQPLTHALTHSLTHPLSCSVTHALAQLIQTATPAPRPPHPPTRALALNVGVARRWVEVQRVELRRPASGEVSPCQTRTPNTTTNITKQKAKSKKQKAVMIAENAKRKHGRNPGVASTHTLVAVELVRRTEGRRQRRQKHG
jgi:hypothetical protein